LEFAGISFIKLIILALVDTPLVLAKRNQRILLNIGSIYILYLSSLLLGNGYLPRLGTLFSLKPTSF
jgi:hypothetical protein